MSAESSAPAPPPAEEAPKMTDFTLKKSIDVCPGNLEILEVQYPLINWKVMFRAHSHLYGKQLSSDILKDFFSKSESYKAFQKANAKWNEEISKLNTLMRKRYDHYQGRMAQANTLVTQMTDAQNKYEALLEATDRTEDQVNEEIGVFDDLCICTAEALRDMENNDRAVGGLTETADMLSALMAKEPTPPEFMKNFLHVEEPATPPSLSEESDESDEEEEEEAPEATTASPKNNQKKKHKKKGKKGKKNKKRR